MRERVVVILTVLNLGILAITLADRRPLEAQGVAAVLRGEALEIVDSRGRVRASIGVLPAESRPGAESIPETVLLRLMTERGRPAIKISTSEEGSGFMAAGPTGTNQTYVSMGSKGTTASVRIRNEQTAERVLTADASR